MQASYMYQMNFGQDAAEEATRQSDTHISQNDLD